MSVVTCVLRKALILREKFFPCESSDVRFFVKEGGDPAVGGILDGKNREVHLENII